LTRSRRADGRLERRSARAGAGPGGARRSGRRGATGSETSGKRRPGRVDLHQEKERKREKKKARKDPLVWNDDPRER
jgi:hypothetical protein